MDPQTPQQARKPVSGSFSGILVLQTVFKKQIWCNYPLNLLKTLTSMGCLVREGCKVIRLVFKGEPTVT